MSRQQAKMVLLCEDGQHEALGRRFFVRSGWHPRSIRIQKSPKGRGAGEQWVRERFPKELQALRRSQVTAVLVAMVDADRSTVESRLEAFDQACQQEGVAPRGEGEPVALLVPRRNIETWIAYLSGIEVNEVEEYPKLSRERDCLREAKALKAMCDAGKLREPPPPSLEAACIEYSTRIRA